jgi:DNA-binding protein YbaB
MMSGSDGAQGDKAVVDAVLRELREAADKWELLVAEAEKTTYSVDLGDVHAVVNSDGRLIELTLDPRVMGHYSHSELADRLNTAFAALRAEAEADNAARYGGGLR